MKTLISKLNELPEELRLLEINISNLDEPTKSLLRSYYGPVVYLKDRELCDRLRDYRIRSGRLQGSTTPDLYEVSLLITGYRSPQYFRFFNHILYSYSREVYKVDDQSTYNCCICFKELQGLHLYNYESQPGYPEHEHSLAYSSSGTGTCICRECLVQLMASIQVLCQVGDGRIMTLLPNEQNL